MRLIDAENLCYKIEQLSYPGLRNTLRYFVDNAPTVDTEEGRFMYMRKEIIFCKDCVNSQQGALCPDGILACVLFNGKTVDAYDFCSKGKKAKKRCPKCDAKMDGGKEND